MSDEDKNVQKARRERALKRQKLLEQQKKREEENARKKRWLLFRFVFYFIVALVLAGSYFAVKSGVAADFLMHQGQKYIEVKEYDKALQMLKIAERMDPDNENIVYLQVLALSKMPVSYSSLKGLYEISQYDDFEESAEYAYKVLTRIRKQIDSQIGDNYIDSVMYDNLVFRLNNKNTIKYTISKNGYISSQYKNEIRRAFKSWSALTNGAILFEEVHGIDDADIVVSMADVLPNVEDKGRSAVTIPIVNNEMLSRVEIILHAGQGLQAKQNPEKLATVIKAQVGHALGLGGYSSDENDVMHSSSDYISSAAPDKRFSLRDLNTLVLLYKLVPDVINEKILPEEYENFYYGEAILSIPGNNIENEVKRLMSYLKSDPQDVPKWVDLATNYAIKQHYGHANAILKNVLPFVSNNYQNNYVVLFNISLNCYKMKDYSAASKYIKLARKLNNTDVDALVLETFINLKSNQKEQALAKLQNINKKYPDNIEVALKLAYIYRKNKDTAKVVDVMNNLLKSNSNAAFDDRVRKYTK